MTDAFLEPQLGLLDYLVKAIFSGRYRPGEMVPKEIDLCKQFSTNRTAVRNNLRQLVDAGIIERISGHGSKVKEYADWNILDPAVTQWMAEHAGPNLEIQREILSFRLDVEPYVAMTAASCATARDLVVLEETLEGMGKNLNNATCKEERRLHSDYDVAFHVAIFKATHNIVWSQVSHILRPAIYLLIEMSNDAPAADPEESLERHRQVMENIRTRKPREAFLAAQGVLEGTAKALGLEPGENSLGHYIEIPPYLGQLSGRKRLRPDNTKNKNNIGAE